MRSYPAQQDVDHFASDHGWVKTSMERKPAPFSGLEMTWSLPNNGTLRYTEDEMTQNCYLVAVAATRDDAQSIGNLILDELFPWELPELILAVDIAPNNLEFGFSVIRLGIAAPPRKDEEIFRRIQSALVHEDFQVRDMAIVATTYSPWPDYIPTLRSISENDPEPELRHRSAMVLESYANAGIREDR